MLQCDLTQGFKGSSGCCGRMDCWGIRREGEELVVWTGWWQKWEGAGEANPSFCGQSSRVGRGLAQGHTEQGSLGL